MARTVPIEKTRNIGIMAHIDAGKTTTTERILYYTGASTSSARCTKARPRWTGWSRSRSAASPSPRPRRPATGGDHRINIIDTPGHVDFTAEVERSLRVLDGAVVVFRAVGGVEPQSETVWRQADKYSVPRIAFVNKMDRVGADFDRCLEMIADASRRASAPVQIPWGARTRFKGIIDLVGMRARRFEEETGRRSRGREIPDDLAARRRTAREKVVEAVCEIDDALLEQLPRRASRSPRSFARRCARDGRGEVVPVLCGAALATRACSRCSTRSSTTCRRRWISRRRGRRRRGHGSRTSARRRGRRPSRRWSSRS